MRTAGLSSRHLRRRVCWFGEGMSARLRQGACFAKGKYHGQETRNEKDCCEGRIYRFAGAGLPYAYLRPVKLRMIVTQLLILKRYRKLSHKGPSFPARLFYCICLRYFKPHVVRRTGQTRKARITASHQPVFDRLPGAGQDQHSYISCL